MREPVAAAKDVHSLIPICVGSCCSHEMRGGCPVAASTPVPGQYWNIPFSPDISPGHPQ